MTYISKVNPKGHTKSMNKEEESKKIIPPFFGVIVGWFIETFTQMENTQEKHQV